MCISFHDVAHSATQTFNSGWPSLWTACSILQRLVGSLGPWGYVPVRQSAAISLVRFLTLMVGTTVVSVFLVAVAEPLGLYVQ